MESGRRTLALLALVGACAVLAGQYLRDGELSSEAVTHVVARPSSEGVIEHSGAVEYVDPVPSGDTRSPVTGQDPRGSGAGDSAPTVWDAFEVLDQAIGSSSPVDMNPLDFEGKYAGATDAQILIAHTAAQSKLERERAKITEGLMAQGRFIESIVREGDPSPFPQATKENPIVSFGFEIEHGNGFQKVRLTEIDANEFPEFHALESEYYWLGSKVSKMKKEQ